MKGRVLAAMVIGLIALSLVNMVVAERGLSQQKQTAVPRTPPKGRASGDSVTSPAADSARPAPADRDTVRIPGERPGKPLEGDTLVFRDRRIPNSAFGAGERLVFDVSYGFVTAGEAIMAVTGIDTVAGRPAYRVEFAVNSLPSFSWIYRVEDRYLTLIDTEWIAPVRFEQKIREGSYKRDFVAEFDQVRHIARTTEGDFPIPPYVHDIMSAFYFTRTLDLKGVKKGDSFTFHNFYKDKSHELVVRVLGRQELEVGAGTFRTVVVEPLVREGGLFKSEGRIVIWLTDDDRKVPVRVNTKVVIGSIDTELREYSGLAGPLPSRIR